MFIRQYIRHPTKSHRNIDIKEPRNDEVCRSNFGMGFLGEVKEAKGYGFPVEPHPAESRVLRLSDIDRR